MLLAHKIELYPTPYQREHLDQACGSRRHCFNQLLAHFKQEGVKWSKAAAYKAYKQLRVEFPWYAEVSARVTLNAIDDLDTAFKHFFRRVKQGKKPGFPRFKKRGLGDSFAFRATSRFAVDGRWLRIEKLSTRLKLAQQVRFKGTHRQVTISRSPDGRYWVSILVEATNYDSTPAPAGSAVGVDLGVAKLATLSDGTEIPASQPLKKGIQKLRKWQRRLSRKVKGSNRRARTKAKVARIHQRVKRQRQATLHELTNRLTRDYETVAIEDLNVRGMVRNHKMSRAIHDTGFGTFRSMLEYKARLRGGRVKVVDRFFPSSKTCSACGAIKSALSLSERQFCCDACGSVRDRDYNAAVNILNYGEDTFRPTTKRTEERSKTWLPGVRADAVNEMTDRSDSVRL